MQQNAYSRESSNYRQPSIGETPFSRLCTIWCIINGNKADGCCFHEPNFNLTFGCWLLYNDYFYLCDRHKWTNLFVFGVELYPQEEKLVENLEHLSLRWQQCFPAWSLCPWKWQMGIHNIDVFSIFLKACIICKTDMWNRTETLRRGVDRSETQGTHERYSKLYEYK
jgi:hypothetical protein